MGFSFGGGGSSNRSSSSGTQSSNEQRNSTQTETGSKTNLQNTAQTNSQNQSGSTSSRGQVVSEQLLSSLDDETLATLQNLITGLSGETGQQSQLSSALQERALTAGVDTSAIVANARRKGEVALGQSQQRLAQGAGSSMNTLVQQFGLEEARNMETELAGLEASLQLQNQQQQIAALSTGLTGTQAELGSNISEIAQLADVLKGATQTQSGSQTTDQQTTELMNSLSSLFGTTDTTELSTLVQNLLSSTQTNSAFSEKGKTKGKGFGIGFSQ